MPTLIKLSDQGAAWADDPFVALDDDAPAPDAGAVILSLPRFLAEGEALLGRGLTLGVRIEPDQAVEDLAYDLGRVSMVAPVFPKFRDGRAFTTAHLLRTRFGFTGEVRAVGDVLRELAPFMVRCGFDAFEPADGSQPEDWAKAAFRHRHVYQRGADGRTPAYIEREGV